MANDRQYKLSTYFVAARGVEEYRQTIPAVVRPEDIVIEAKTGERGPRGLEGTVQDVAYVGGRYECAIKAAGAEFVLDMPASLKLAKGQVVTLNLKEVTVWPR